MTPTALKCPSCGSEKILSIHYGKPTQDAMERAARGEFKLGGCELSPENPNRHCSSCGHRWLDKTDPSWIAGEELRTRLKRYQDERKKA